MKENRAGVGVVWWTAKAWCGLGSTERLYVRLDMCTQDEHRVSPAIPGCSQRVMESDNSGRG